MHGRLNKITTPAGDFEYTRLASSELVAQMTRPNGVTSTWSYESNRNLITQVQNGSISTYGYVNDAIGRRTSMSRSGSAHPVPDTISYSYNDRSEVTGALSDVYASYSYAYAYDPIGNRVTANEAGVPWTYTTNNLNQYTSATEDNAQLNFSYDLDGSMTYRPVDAATGWTQVWNGENRMVETYKGNERLTFQYDYMGRRVEKKVYDGQNLATHLKFVYDGFKLVEELDGLNADAPLRRYAWQPDDVGLDMVLQMTEVSNAAHSFHLHDANKNVMQMTDAVGNASETCSYAPFGEAVAAGGSMHFFGFSSEVSEPETGLNYYNYRYYWHNGGKWVSRDPVNEKDHVNLYEFVHNSPIIHVDRHGRETENAGRHYAEGYSMIGKECYNNGCRAKVAAQRASCLAKTIPEDLISVLLTFGSLFIGNIPGTWIGGMLTMKQIYEIKLCFDNNYARCVVPCRFCTD